MVGVRRIGEYRESKTEATRFHCAFFLVSRSRFAHWSGQKAARVPLREDVLFLSPPHIRLPLSLPLAQIFLFLFYSPYPELHIPVFDHALLHHAMPRYTILHRTVSSLLSRLAWTSRSLSCNGKRVFLCI